MNLVPSSGTVATGGGTLVPGGGNMVLRAGTNTSEGGTMVTGGGSAFCGGGTMVPGSGTDSRHEAPVSGTLGVRPSFQGDERKGEFHDQGDAKWILMRRSLWGHNDTP
jgi:hypothetical protein